MRLRVYKLRERVDQRRAIMTSHTGVQRSQVSKTESVRARAAIMWSSVSACGALPLYYTSYIRVGLRCVEQTQWSLSTSSPIFAWCGYRPSLRHNNILPVTGSTGIYRQLTRTNLVLCGRSFSPPTRYLSYTIYLSYDMWNSSRI